MFKRFFGGEPTDQEKVQIAQSVQAKFAADNFSDATIHRFCVAREWDESKIVAMLEEHRAWRAKELPVQRTPGIDRVLESGRLTVVRRGASPILMVDFMWGKFLLDGYDADDIIRAQYLILEDILAEADSLSPQDQPGKFISLSTGGPPPSAFAKKISELFDVNYPERCQKAIIYPIPRMFKHLANVILMLVPKKTREKFSLLSEEQELCEALQMAPQDLPEILKGGMEAMKARREKAAQDERTKDQLPQEYHDALANPDTALQTSMSQAAC